MGWYGRFLFKELCHEIERKALNVITRNFKDSVEPQELFNINHHTIILTNDASQIPPFLKDLFPKVPHFYQILSIMIGLNLNLTVILLLVEWGLDICLEVKVLHRAMVHQCLVHPIYHLRGEHLKEKLLSWKHFINSWKGIIY